MTKKIIISLFLVLVIILALLLIESFKHDYFDKAEKSDTIIILGGGDQGRVQRAAELYKSGYADNVIITPVEERYTSQELITILTHYGFDEEDITIEEESTSTYSNAEEIIKIMENKNFESSLVVTSDYHTKGPKLLLID